MRKYVALLGAAAASAALIVAPALAAAPARHANAVQSLQRKQDIVVIRRHNSRRVLFIQRHSHHSTSAHVASCPAGNFNASYCTPPKLDTLFGAFSTGGSAAFGSNNYYTCRELGYSSAPCGVYTNVANELLVALVSADGPSGGGQSLTVSCTTSTGGACPVTFHKVNGENLGLGDAEVWYADAGSIITKTAPIFVTTSAAKSGCVVSGHSTACDVSMNLVTFQNAIAAGASGAQGTGIGNASVCYSAKAAPSCSLKTSEPDSWVWSAANDWGGASLRTVPSGQNALVQIEDLTAKKTFWIQSTSSPDPSTLAIGSTVTINDTAPASDPFNLALVEIL